MADSPRNAPPRDASGPPVALSGARVPERRSPGNLPLELTSFIGREKETAEVKRLLAETRLLTLTGPGGYGKTRLALRVAKDLLVEGFEDGVWLVELASLSDPALVPQAVASVLDVREAPGRPLTEMLAEHLKAKKTLLLLDNCEHLVDACAALADTLLRACPYLRILATGREALGVPGETVRLVPSLSLPEPKHLPPVEELTRYEAVRLFVERAAATSRFEMTDRNASAVARLCRRLDGVPLAIELAAARVRALSVEQILTRLDDCFRLLTGGSRTALPRQQTLRATIDWSHGLLSEEEKVLFQRLSVFVGRFGLEAAEACAGGVGIEKGQVLDLLTRLVDKSLVLVAEGGGEARYRLLEMVRQYGWEKLQGSEEAPEIRRHHANFFLELAEEAEPAVVGGSGEEAWLERLEDEHDNLRAALGWLREEGAAERGLRLGGALWWFWFQRGYWSEGRDQLEGVLALDGASERTAARAKALLGVGILAWMRGDRTEGRAYQEESLAIYKELGDEPYAAGALRGLGNVNFELGDWEAARRFLDESLLIERELGNRHAIALTLNYLGWLTHFQEDHAAARRFLEESLGIFRELGDELYVAVSLFFLGRLATNEGDYAAAHACLEEIAKTFPLAQYRWTVPRYLEAWARLAAAQGQAEKALRLAGAAATQREIINQSESPIFVTDLERRLASAWRALGEEGGAAAWEEGRTLTLEGAIAETTSVPSERLEGPASKARPSLRIFALGPARVERGERVLTSSAWTYAKPRELLYYLLSHPSQTKEQVGLALWPDASPAQLRRAFHSTLHHLRRALGGTEWIVFEKGRYAFDRSLNYWFDVEAFESELAEARRAEAPDLAVAHLQGAVELYGGDFLEDFADGEWALVRQEELRREYQEALLALGQLLFAEDRYAEAAGAYRKAIAHDELLEAAHRELMRCHTALGERGRALRHYRSLIELLEDELGASPAPETTALYERLRRGEGV